MFRKLALATVAAVALTGGTANAAGEAHITDYSFSFEGPFGSFDQNQLQRGLQVYTEICAACHGLRYVPIRTLGDEGGPGYSEAEVRTYAAFFEIYDADLDDWRPATPNDNFPESALASAPDLSLMAKARAGFHGPYGLGLNQLFNGLGGSEYIASLLAGYEDPPECAPADFDGHYNTAFGNGSFPAECIDEEGHHIVAGSWIAMSQPIWGDDVEFSDGSGTDIESISQDVSAFLMWAAEPKLMARKQMGLVAVIMLTILSVLLYATNKTLWAPIKARAKGEDTPAE
jgi:ubiquinol-cytochrome c reductase cytochrome c1 subunit